jgi:hypothetical protein
MWIFCCSFDYRTILSFMKDLEQNTSFGSNNGTVTSDWAPARRAALLLIALVEVDYLEAAGLIPLQLEDLLAVDADLEVEKIRLAAIPISPQSADVAW